MSTSNIRRMGAATLAVVALGSATALASPTGSPALAAGQSVGQTGYECQYISGKVGLTKAETTLQMTLDVPSSVAPGSKLLLRGMLRIVVPASAASGAKGLVTTGQGYSDTMSVQVGVNGQETVFGANRWQTPQEPTSGDGAIVVDAPISFPAYTVPANAQGAITLTMPTNNVLKNTYSKSPATLAWSAQATASGPLGPLKFNLACYLVNGQPSVIAKIPVSSRQTGGSTTSSGTSGGTHTSAGATGTGATGTGATGTGTLGTGSTGTGTLGTGAAGNGTTGTQATGTGNLGTGAVGNGEVGTGGAGNTAAVAPGQVAGSAPVDGALTAATPVAAAPEHGVYVPTGLLLGIGFLVVLGSLTYAAWARYRLRILQNVGD